MAKEQKKILDLDALAQRLDNDPELKDDIVIRPLWDKLVLKTQSVIEKEKRLNSLRQEVGEDRGSAKVLLDLISERVQVLDDTERKKKAKKG